MTVHRDGLSSKPSGKFPLADAVLRNDTRAMERELKHLQISESLAWHAYLEELSTGDHRTDLTQVMDGWMNAMARCDVIEGLLKEYSL